MFGFAPSTENPGLVLLLALLLDAAAGDPAWLYRRVPHPVALIGRVIAIADRRLNREAASARRAFLSGLVSACGVTLFAAAVGWLIAETLAGLRWGWLIEALVASTLLAFRGLYDHARAVTDGLVRGLEAGRIAVHHLVGRDPASLDAAGVARATVESVAENFSDGVVAPAFWYAVLGLPGLCAYKAINTLDSMLGHWDERYAAFGKASARLDDMVNWLPARLAAALLILAATIHPGASPSRAVRVVWRDARKHRSVNAGWGEAALAGALGFALAGPRCYEGRWTMDHWMGGGRAELSVRDIEAALRLYVAATCLLAGLFIAMWLLI